MLCYATLPSRRHFGCTASSRHGSGRSLDSPESQCSIGFQPVFCSRHRTAFSKLPPFLGDVYKDQGFNPGNRPLSATRPEEADRTC